MEHAEVAELVDALDSNQGALPRAGSIPAFGISVVTSSHGQSRLIAPCGYVTKRRPSVAEVREMSKRVALPHRRRRLSGPERGHPGGDAQVARPGLRSHRRPRGPARPRRRGVPGARLSLDLGILAPRRDDHRHNPDEPVQGRRRRRARSREPGVRELDALVAIGGEDTLGVAARLFEEHGYPVVGVPKTIDNDLSATDYTFGFDTAVTIATEAIDRLHTTAESDNRVWSWRWGGGTPAGSPS